MRSRRFSPQMIFIIIASFLFVFNLLSSNSMAYSVDGNITSTKYNGTETIYISVYDGNDPNTNTLLGQTSISAPGPFSIPNIPDMGDTNCWVYAFLDVDGSGALTTGDYYGLTTSYIRNSIYVPELTVEIPYSGCIVGVGTDLCVGGNITSTKYNGTGTIYISVYDGNDPNTNTLLGQTSISAPGPFSIPNIPDMGDTNCWLYAFWDVDGNGIMSPGDYYGLTTFYIRNPVYVTTLTVETNYSGCLPGVNAGLCYAIDYFFVRTITTAGSPQKSECAFKIKNMSTDGWGFEPIDSVISSGTIKFPDGSQMAFSPVKDIWTIAEFVARDNNRNGAIESNEYSKTLNYGVEYRFSLPFTPHPGGAYILNVNCTNGQSLQKETTVAAGFPADQFPPVNGVGAVFDQQSQRFKISWNLPTEPYAGGSKIEIKADRFRPDGTDRRYRFRIRDLLPALTEYSLFPWESDNIRLYNSYLPFIRIEVLVHSPDGATIASATRKEYIVNDNASLDPTTIRVSVKGDIDDNGTIGLEEAINALQTISGLR